MRGCGGATKQKINLGEAKMMQEKGKNRAVKKELIQMCPADQGN